MTEITEITDRHTWDSLWGGLEGHPLQSWQWGELKSETGPWAVRRISVSEGGSAIGAAQILIRKLPWPFRNMCCNRPISTAQHCCRRLRLMVRGKHPCSQRKNRSCCNRSFPFAPLVPFPYRPNLQNRRNTAYGHTGGYPAQHPF